MARKRVLITGAGTGIGLACTKMFLDGGWEVLAHYHRSCQELKNLQRSYTSLDIVQADFSNAGQVKKFLKTVRREKLHALVNNAAVYDFSYNSSDRMKAAQDVLFVNVIVPTLLAETVFDVMKKLGEGHIVNVSSVGAKYGSSQEHVFYGISKRGLEALTRTLARAGAPFNISVNTVRPGVIDTPFHDKIKRDMRKRSAMIPMKRMGKPEEVASLIYHLCDAQTFMTNQTITVAGGE